MDDFEVVIIGAGICGLATALALHKKGIKSVVMERSETLRNATGAAIGIRQNGWRALDQLGVADTLRRTAIAIQRERIVGLNGGKQEEMSVKEPKGEARCLTRKNRIDTLYAALPPTTVKFGCKLESIQLDPNTTNPILHFIDGSSIMAKVVIGCDGVKSNVANFLNLKPTKTFPLCGVRGLSNYPKGHSFDYEFASFRKDKNLVGRIPIDDNLVYWFCVQPYIRRGTVTVAGDAMHAMGPFLGQGTSAGLEDAVVLARNMANMGLNRVEEAFNLYVKQRRMRLVRLSLHTCLTSMLLGTSSRLKKLISIVLLSLLFCYISDHTYYDCGRL